MTDYRSIMIALAKQRPWAQITTTYGCSRRSIDKAQRVIRTYQFTLADIEKLTTGQIRDLFPDNRRRNDEDFLPPDFAAVAARRQQRKRVTLKVEHARYLTHTVAVGQRHYSYKQFCRLFDHYVDESGLTTQITRVAGDEMTVDWAGTTMSIADPITGHRQVIYLFVAVLPHSGMVFAAGFTDMRMRAWLTGHQQALEYFGGVPQRVMPDNASTATNQIVAGVRARDVNQAYFDFGDYFGFAITPARPVKPKDKASVEKGVDIVTTWVIEYLDDREFYDLEHLNDAIMAQVDWINDRPGFRGHSASRREIFTAHEAAVLSPLPDGAWSWSTWRTAKVGMNYHIRVNKHFYSVPWRFAGRGVDVQIFDTWLEVFADGVCLAVHQLKPANMGYTTLDEHVPARHKDLATKWDRERIESWAKSIGTATHTLICQMFDSRRVEAQAYSTTLAVLGLAKQYSRAQLEAACQHLIDRGDTPSVRRVIDEIRSHQLSPGAVEPTSSPLSTLPAPRPAAPAATARTPMTSSHSHVRGKTAFTFRDEV